MALAQGRGAPAPSVVVQQVVARDITPTFTHVGRVEAVATVELRARVEGFLERRDFREGAEVEKGALLYMIEKAPYEVVVQQREAELASVRATLTNAQSDFKRKSSLRGRGNVSQASVDEARANLGTARANVLKAEAALRQANLDLSYTEIHSPITGQISASEYSVGNLVGPNSDPLATVYSVDPIHVTIAVSEKLLLNARREGIDLQNPPVAPSLILSDGSRYPLGGSIDYLSPQVDRRTDTVTSRAVFHNPNRVLVPGQFVTVEIRRTDPITAVVTPQVSVQQDGKGHFVLVVDRENKVEVRRVQVGQQVDSDWEITQGLATGERVIIRGIQKVRPDQVVNPVGAGEG